MFLNLSAATLFSFFSFIQPPFSQFLTLCLFISLSTPSLSYTSQPLTSYFQTNNNHTKRKLFLLSSSLILLLLHLSRSISFLSFLYSLTEFSLGLLLCFFFSLAQMKQIKEKHLNLISLRNLNLSAHNKQHKTSLRFFSNNSCSLSWYLCSFSDLKPISYTQPQQYPTNSNE